MLENCFSNLLARPLGCTFKRLNFSLKYEITRPFIKRNIKSALLECFNDILIRAVCNSESMRLQLFYGVGCKDSRKNCAEKRGVLAIPLCKRTYRTLNFLCFVPGVLRVASPGKLNLCELKEIFRGRTVGQLGLRYTSNKGMGINAPRLNTALLSRNESRSTACKGVKYVERSSLRFFTQQSFHPRPAKTGAIPKPAINRGILVIGKTAGKVLSVGTFLIKSLERRTVLSSSRKG